MFVKKGTNCGWSCCCCCCCCCCCGRRRRRGFGRLKIHRPGLLEDTAQLSLPIAGDSIDRSAAAFSTARRPGHQLYVGAHNIQKIFPKKPKIHTRWAHTSYVNKTLGKPIHVWPSIGAPCHSICNNRPGVILWRTRKHGAPRHHREKLAEICLFTQLENELRPT